MATILLSAKRRVKPKRKKKNRMQNYKNHKIEEHIM